MLRRSLLSLSVTATLCLGLTAPGCGDDDVELPPDMADATVDSEPPPQDAAAPTADADADGGDPWQGIEECTSCVLDECLPSLFSCLLDEACRELAMCVITSNCLNDLPSCMLNCVDPSTPPAEIFAQLLMLQEIAESCTGCVDTCEGAIPGDFDGGFGFPGLPGGGGFPGATEAPGLHRGLQSGKPISPVLASTLAEYLATPAP